MIRFSLFVAILLSFLSLNLFAEVEIYLKKTATVSGSSVSLGAVSSIKINNIDNGVAELKSKLQGLILSRFSPGEKNKSISYTSIQTMVRSLFKGELYLIGSGVQVNRSAFFFKEAEIKKQVLKYLASEIDNTRFKVDIISKEKELFSHNKKDKLLISVEKGSIDGAVLILTVKTENSLHVLRVRCELQKLQAVVIAKKDILLTTKFTLADYEIKKVPLSSLSVGFVENIRVGTIALRDIKAGTIIKADDIRTPLLVKYGDIVNVLFREGGVSIKMRAKAIKEGRAGDIIELENTITYKKFYGKIDSKGCVLVGLEGN